MVKAVSVYPYVAVKLIRYEDLVHAVNIEARYGPKEEEGTYWDIRDIQQVCLVYKGVWKSEVEDWKKGCNRLTSVNWAEVALTGAMNKDQTVDEELDSDSNPAGVSASGSSARRVVTRSLAATLAANAATTTTTVASALPISEDPLPAVPNSAAPTLNTGTTATTQMPVKVALNPEQRFDEYRARTLHRRSRICPACDYEYCNHSRFNEEEDCDCGECDGDAESDEFFKYYEGNEGEEEQDSQAGTPGSYDSPSENTASAERGEPKETIASVMVPGHRARVVQCIYMEAF